MKKTLIAITVLSVTFLCFSAFDSEPIKYRIVRIAEPQVGYMGIDPKIYISDEVGDPLVLDLEKLNDKNMTEHIKTINETFNRLASQGYRLISSNVSGASGYLSTYVFEKK